MTTLRSVFLAAVLAGFALPAAPPAANPAKAGMDPQRLARIPGRMKQFVEKGTIAGAVTLVQRHGALASLEGVGYQDVAAKTPIRTDTIFQIMSMTKPVTAAGVMILMEEGRLALNDPVEKYLPEFRSMWMVESRDGNRQRTLKRPARAITIRDLLTHTSGLYSDNPPALQRWKLWMSRTLAEVVAIGSQQPLDFEPGTKWQYSNIGIAALGRIIEVVSDQPYEKFLDQRLFQPLGMTDSFFFPPAGKADRIASVYVYEKERLKENNTDADSGWDIKTRKGARYPMPEGGLYSTAGDLANFYQMMLNGGTLNGKRILSKPTVDLMTRIHTGSLEAGHNSGMGYGLAWAVVKEPVGSLALPLNSIGSYGHGGAFGTYGWVDPARDMVGVFLVQRPGATEERNAFMAIAGSAIVD